MPSLHHGLAALLTAAVCGLTSIASVEAQSWRSLTSSRAVQGEDRLDVQIEYGAGSFELGSGSTRNLYEFELRYNEDLVKEEVK